jgi:hypothetical protein
VRTAFDSPTYTPSMIFWTARCRINSEAAALAATERTPKRSGNVGAPTCLGKSAPPLLGIFNRFADVLIRVLCHAPAHPVSTIIIRDYIIILKSLIARQASSETPLIDERPRGGAANAVPAATTIRMAGPPAFSVAVESPRRDTAHVAFRQQAIGAIKLTRKTRPSPASCSRAPSAHTKLPPGRGVSLPEIG